MAIKNHVIKTHVSKDSVSLYTIQDKNYFADNGFLYIVPRVEMNNLLKYVENKENTIIDKINFLKNKVSGFTLMLQPTPQKSFH